MKLKSLIIADPVTSVAETLSEQCAALSDDRIIVTDANTVVQVVSEKQPDMIILSLELGDPKQLIPKLKRAASALFLTCTYRELTVRAMEKLVRLGADEFFSQPLDVVDCFRAASRRFGHHFRRHERYNVSIEVSRLDGVVIGRTRDLSEGGMCMDAIHPLAAGESILCHLALPDASEPLRLRCVVLQVEGAAPMAVSARLQFKTLRGPEHRRLVHYLATRPGA